MAAEPENLSSWQQFQSDLVASLRAWRAAPLLPLISVVLAHAVLLPGAWVWVGFPFSLFLIGWVGTERIWYLRIFRNKGITRNELWRYTWAFFWRFARLGVVLTLLFMPVVLFAWWRSNNLENAFASAEVSVLSVVVGVAIDFSFTFVTQALAFTTRKVTDALRIGLPMIKDHWPHTAWYALVPPLVVVGVVRTSQPRVGATLGAVLSVLAVLLNVWFKGAAAAFYIRRMPVGDDGAAFVGLDVERSGEARFGKLLKGCLVAFVIFIVLVFIMNVFRASEI